jgi:hypothetical protein
VGGCSGQHLLNSARPWAQNPNTTKTIKTKPLFSVSFYNPGTFWKWKLSLGFLSFLSLSLVTLSATLVSTSTATWVVPRPGSHFCPPLWGPGPHCLSHTEHFISHIRTHQLYTNCYDSVAAQPVFEMVTPLLNREQGHQALESYVPPLICSFWAML